MSSARSSPTKRKVYAESTETAKRPHIDNPNKAICDFLNELAEHEKNVARNIHKYNAYRKASRSIAATDKAIKSGQEAKKLEGVGAKIAAKIDEFLTTGKLKKLEKIHDDPGAKAIQLIASIVGFGPAAAQELVSRGITTVEGVAKQPNLTHTQRIGVKYFEDLSQRIPRKEVERLRDQAADIVASCDPDLKLTACGSFRRGAATCGDLDMLMTHNNEKKPLKGMLKRVVAQLEKAGLVTDTMSCGETKFMGICRDLHPSEGTSAIHRRIDIRLLPKNQFPTAVLYFTGPDELNKRMRRRAIEMGFRLSEYDIRPVGETGKPGDPLPVTSEKDVFDYLDMTYIEPEDRA